MLEHCSRLKKRCKQNANTEPVASCKSRLPGIATAPPCGTSFFIMPGRGPKRKIGCIDVTTQMGRKKKIEDGYVYGETIGQGKFGSVWCCRSRASGALYACKTLRKREDTIHREVEIMQHLSGHPGVVTLQAVYEEAGLFHFVMELCSGGRLIDRIVKKGPYSEQRAANILTMVQFQGIHGYHHSTQRTLRMLPIETKLKHQIGATSCQFVVEPEQRLGGNRICDGSPSEVSSQLYSEDQEDCVLIDVLVSEKQVVWTTGPINQQASSNVKANNLRKAF